jgi:hypothetical protein
MRATDPIQLDVHHGTLKQALLLMALLIATAARAAPVNLIPLQREALSLQRQMAAVDASALVDLHLDHGGGTSILTDILAIIVGRARSQVAQFLGL